MDAETPGDDEEEEVQEQTSSTSGDRGSRGNSNRGRGGGARGGRTPNNTGKTPPKNQAPVGSKKQTKDAEGIYNFLQSSDGKVALNHRGHPMCYYCGIPSHQRSECRIRLKDLDNGIKRPFHPARGNLPINYERKLKSSCPMQPSYGVTRGQAHRQHKPRGPNGQTTTTNRLHLQ